MHLAFNIVFAPLTNNDHAQLTLSIVRPRKRTQTVIRLARTTCELMFANAKCNPQKVLYDSGPQLATNYGSLAKTKVGPEASRFSLKTKMNAIEKRLKLVL